MKRFLYISIALSLLSCNKQPVAKQGTIEITTRIFYNASQGLEDMEVFHISKLHFLNDNFMEYVPSLYDGEIIDSIFLIKEGRYYNLEATSSKDLMEIDYKNIPFEKSVFDKKTGAMWIPQKDSIFGYGERNILTDTIWDDRDFKRFSIADENHLALFWVEKKDTILPYSLNRIADNDYNGRITRIDTYEKTRDLFSTVILDYSPEVEKGIIQILKDIE